MSTDSKIALRCVSRDYRVLGSRLARPEGAPQSVRSSTGLIVIPLPLSRASPIGDNPRGRGTTDASERITQLGREEADGRGARAERAERMSGFNRRRRRRVKRRGMNVTRESGWGEHGRRKLSELTARWGRRGAWR